jgi:hypothetical protein
MANELVIGHVSPSYRRAGGGTLQREAPQRPVLHLDLFDEDESCVERLAEYVE